MYNASEIFQFALQIEENGHNFYTKMSQKITNTEIKDLFVYLAKEEIEHKKKFESILSTIETYDEPTYPKEYFDYLHAYVHNTIFNENTLNESIMNVSDPYTALSFAISMEADSIAYYLQIKNMLIEKDRLVIDKIIEEERKHYVQLTEARKWL